MTLGSFGYVINDAFIKLVAEDLPLFQSILIRGLFITAILIVLASQRGELVGSLQHVDRPLVLRIAMECIGTAMYLSALTRVPLAGLIAVLQIVPLVVTFVAARLLREAVSLHRVLSVLVGFAGVMLVVRPGSNDFNPWFIVGFGVVAAIVVREVATKNISPKLPSLFISLCTAIAISVMGLIGSAIEGWETPTGRELLLLGGAAAFLTVGYVASVVTIRVGDISFSAPFRYTILIFAIILQIIVFDDVPDILTFVGAAIVALAGLYAFTREAGDSATASAPR